jgi:type I restriction enzyme S subunit
VPRRATFFIGHLPRLTANPVQIHTLRQTILSLAVQGKLVQQNPEDDSSESLLSAIRNIRVVAASRTKNSAVNDSDPKFIQHLPQSLPTGWVACPLEDLFKFVDYRGRTPTRTTKGVRLITAKNVRMGHVANDPVEFIDERAYGAWMTRGFPQIGDLLFVTEGATMGFVGTVELPFVFALAQRTIDLQPYLRCCSRFFLFTLMSPIFQDAIAANSTGTAVKGIKAAKLKRIRVPLPPLAEQHRIVAKVDELMTLCDQLEASLKTSQTEASRLLESVLHNALDHFAAHQMSS